MGEWTCHVRWLPYQVWRKESVSSILGPWPKLAADSRWGVYGRAKAQETWIWKGSKGSWDVFRIRSRKACKSKQVALARRRRFQKYGWWEFPTWHVWTSWHDQSWLSTWNLLRSTFIHCTGETICPPQGGSFSRDPKRLRCIVVPWVGTFIRSELAIHIERHQKPSYQCYLQYVNVCKCM